MRTFDEIEQEIDAIAGAPGDASTAAARMLALGEEVLEMWVGARDETPTSDKKEGFRVLALHRQGAKGDPSFNACRETARELVYYYNLVTLELEHPQMQARLGLMAMVARHLCLFVAGKMQVAGLGEFCCSSRPLRQAGE